MAFGRAMARHWATGLTTSNASSVVDAEAGMVRDIFRRFLDFGSMGRLVEFLQTRRATDQALGDARWQEAVASHSTAMPYTACWISRMLIGEVYYDGEWHRGQHTPIVDLEL